MLTSDFSDFLDYYYDLLSYVHNRQTRLGQFKAQNPPPPATPEAEYSEALETYLGRERANLRKRRTRLRQGDFQILTQVGQGGYGQVYLAQKKDTREVCALKVMSKKLLFKLDEVRHVLTERDILTNAKSEWLVSLLYAFQDERSIYLAMVCLDTTGMPIVLIWNRNMSPAATFGLFSTIPVCSTTDMLGFILQRCLLVSMRFTSWDTFTVT